MIAPGPFTLKRLKLIWLFWDDVSRDVRTEHELSSWEFADQILESDEFLSELSASEVLLFTLFVQEFFDNEH